MCLDIYHGIRAESWFLWIEVTTRQVFCSGSIWGFEIPQSVQNSYTKVSKLHSHKIDYLFKNLVTTHNNLHLFYYVPFVVSRTTVI